jgi:hypothetical protein
MEEQSNELREENEMMTKERGGERNSEVFLVIK